MRLTRRTNLAMRVLMYCAVNDDGPHRSADIAAACNVSGNHMMHVVPVLHRNGMVLASRGRFGGVSLGRAADQIAVGQVFRLFESGLPFAECFEAKRNTCPLTAHCRLRVALKAALEAFYTSLDEITVADLVEDNSGLEALLAFQPSTPPACARTTAH